MMGGDTPGPELLTYAHTSPCLLFKQKPHVSTLQTDLEVVTGPSQCAH